MLFHIGAKLWIWDDTIRYLDVGPLVGWLGGVCFCVQWCRCFTWFVGLFSFVCMRLGCRSTFRDYDTLQCKWHAASWTCTRYETTMNAGWSHHRMAGSQPEYDFCHWIFIWKAKNFWFFSLFHFGYTSCGMGTWCKFTNIRKKNSHSLRIEMVSLEFQGFMFKLQSRIFTNWLNEGFFSLNGWTNSRKHVYSISNVTSKTIKP